MEKKDIALIILGVLLVIMIIVVIVLATKKNSTSLQCIGSNKYVTCNQNTCSIQYPTVDAPASVAGQLYNVNANANYSTPTIICQVKDNSNPAFTTSILNVLSFVRSMYPMADLATSNDLQFITQYLNKNSAVQSSTIAGHFKNHALYYDYGTNQINAGYPTCPTSPVNSCSITGWAASGNEGNCWIRIPTMDSWSVINANMVTAAGNNFTVNQTAVMMIL